MKTALTGSLVVCVAAAGIAVGALALEPGGPPAPAAQPTAPPAPGAAPSGDPYGDAGAPTAAPSTVTLEISDFTFSAPAVASGSSVAVSNLDGVSHTVTADDGSFQSGTVDAGATGSFVAPSAPGTYQYHCEIHPQMNGALAVG